MDVTTDNYSQVKKMIIETILPKTKFIAYDLEFTGVKNEKFQRDYINLLPFEKYKKLRYIAENYQILQLGMTFVTFEDGLKAYPFNFYLFPRNPVTFDKQLKMQLSCVKFNDLNGMDWNKWINKGINYIKISQIELKQGSSKHKSSQAMLDYWSEDWQQVGQKLIRKLGDINRQKVGTQLKYSNHKIPFAQKGLVNLFHAYVQQKQFTLSLEQVGTDFVITKISAEEMKKVLDKARDESLGFALLFKEIWNSKKTFIGHNCFLDLLYVYHNLVDNLPENYFEFKSNIQKSGHQFFDTKYIAQKQKHLSQGGTRLQDIFKSLNQLGQGKEKLTKIALEYPFNRYSIEKQVLHEAGYDSYLTAWVYQQSMKFYDNLHQECKNKLNINKSFFFMNLSEAEDEVNPYYAENILRFNILMGQNDDVRQKRSQLVKSIHKRLKEVDGAYSLHEGYREVFLEIKSHRPEVVEAIMSFKKQDQREKKQSFEVNTFGAYFLWQKERVTRQYNRYQKPYNNKGFEKNWAKEETASESNSVRGNRNK